MCRGIFVHCVKRYYCDWQEKELNGQSLGRRDLAVERENKRRNLGTWVLQRDTERKQEVWDDRKEMQHGRMKINVHGLIKILRAS